MILSCIFKVSLLWSTASSTNYIKKEGMEPYCRCLCYWQIGTNDYMYCDYSIVILKVSFFQGLMFEYLEF